MPSCETLFGMPKIPGDSQVRAKLAPIEPSRFDPMFDAVIGETPESQCQCGLVLRTTPSHRPKRASCALMTAQSSECAARGAGCGS